MLLSIFPKAEPHPKTADEKAFQSRYSSTPHLPETLTVRNDDELISIITNNAWSPSVFRGARKIEHFISTDFMVLDIDDGLTIEQAELRCRNFGHCFLILPTTRHSPDLHKFRIIFPLVRTITTRGSFHATWDKLQWLFPELDSACRDCARFYFASTTEDGVFCEGKLLEPELDPKARANQELVIKEWRIVDKAFYEGKNLLEVIYGETLPEKIPESVDFFLKNAGTGIGGGWRNALNAFVFTLSVHGVEDDKITDLVQTVAPETLDSRDKTTIKTAMRDGKIHRGEM